MTGIDLQSQCEIGQQRLMDGEYLEAEAALAAAEQEAWKARDWDSLARLYMPLQEARRQRRQRCGEGIVCLDLIAEGPEDVVEARHIVENYPQGQLLVAGWESIGPAVEVRRLQAEHGLYLETFLAAVYRVGKGRAVVIVPTEEWGGLEETGARSMEELRGKVPSGCIVLGEDGLPRGGQRGNAEAYGRVMGMWERLHRPLLATADARKDAVKRIEAYRKVIVADYACELAHQRVAEVAAGEARRAGGRRGGEQ
jgi:hypothetical protein